jgi:L-cystine transport system ATP-binding protein
MIKLEHLNKTFGNHQALTDINTEFKEHQTTVIVGPSGSGKSTLLRSLNLLERPEQGLYHFNDETIDFAKPLTNKTILNIRRKNRDGLSRFTICFPISALLKMSWKAPCKS